ncbi:MAG TPA: hypothetical protein VGI00_16555 [Streptosporangiaceae bacterium]
MATAWISGPPGPATVVVRWAQRGPVAEQKVRSVRGVPNCG